MGNPNTQYFNWNRFFSLENSTVRYVPFTNGVTSNPAVGDWEAILPERTEIHELNIRQTILDFQVPTLTIEFMTNGISYFDILWSNTDPPKEFDFSVIGSNTLVSPAGDPPLIMEAGESLGLRITDGNRLNNSDRLQFAGSLWGVRFPT